MAIVFLPPRDKLTAAGYASVAHVPVLFDSHHRYMRDYNRHLRERACLDWIPGGDSVTKRRARGRRLNYPRPATLRTYAWALANWIEWCEHRGVDWHLATYAADVLRYQAEMLSGAWSAAGEPLTGSTADFRVARATEFLVWAHSRNLRPELAMPIRGTTRPMSDAVGGTVAAVSSRPGRRPRADPAALCLPNPEQITAWLAVVERERGYVKELACRTLLLTGMRRKETAMLPVKFLPDDRKLWKVVDDHVRFWVTRGTKGGKPREIGIPLALAEELDRYRKLCRKTALALWTENHPGCRSPIELFLSQATGEPLSAAKLYEAWVRSRPFKGWCPQLGRHYWACNTLIAHLEVEAQKIPQTLAALPGTWIHAWGETVISLIIKPQLGHADESTTRMYLTWLLGNLSITNHALNWYGFLDRRRDDG